ncbi:hypothetical protein CPB85DRAFT_834025 [Mucidula mucida]|nr:hypothetical protein CPB85DRAFT_834025 [Mucidula mucida]
MLERSLRIPLSQRYLTLLLLCTLQSSFTSMSSHSSTDTTTSDWTSTSPTSMSSDDPLSRSTSQETDSTVGPDVDRGAEMTWVHYVALNRTQKRCVFKRKSNATRSSRRRKATQPRRVPTYEGYDSGEDGSRVGSPEPASRAEYRLMIISAMTKNSASAHFVPRDLPVIQPETTYRALKRPRMQDQESSSDCSRYDARRRVVRRKLNHRKLKISTTMSDTSPSSPGPVTPPDSPARFGAVRICVYDEL